MCGTEGTNFDGDLCNNCDHIFNGVLNVVSEYGGSVTDRPDRAVTVRMMLNYMSAQSDDALVP